MIIGVVGILALPLNPSTTITIMYTVLFIISYLAYQVNSTITWAMMEEGAVPEKYSGTAAGLISTIGYLPDVFISILAGATLDAFPGVTGFRYFFGFLIAMLTLGTLAVMMWKRLLKKQKLAQ
jgi:nitrate/nitrite transporter NarK